MATFQYIKKIPRYNFCEIGSYTRQIKLKIAIPVHFGQIAHSD